MTIERREPQPTTTLRRRWIIGIAAAVVVVLIVVLAIWRSSADDAAPAPAPTTGSVSPGSTSPTSTSAPSPTTSTSAASATPSESPAPAPSTSPSVSVTELPEPEVVDITATATPSPQVEAWVEYVEQVTGEPQGVGEIAGPALRIRLALHNTSGAAIPLDTTVVDVTYGADDTPATEVSGPGREPFTGQLEPDGLITGVYVFVVPLDQRSLVTIHLQYAPDADVVAFRGSVADAPMG